MRYFTSDLHLGSKLINEYAHRPFTDAESAYLALKKNIQDTVSFKSSLIHVGDFLLKGTDRHGKVEDVGLDKTLEDYLREINRRIFLLAGNHDDSHNAEADAKSLVIDLNQKWRNVYVSHFPSYHEWYRGPKNHKFITINLCGHVHDKWLFRFDLERNVLNINVGVDVWNYKPVSDAQITDLLDYLKMYVWQDFDSLGGLYWQMSKSDFEQFVKDNEIKVKKAREQRKIEKHIKKGLTPEECERRRIEAMKKKGLI